MDKTIFFSLFLLLFLFLATVRAQGGDKDSVFDEGFMPEEDNGGGNWFEEENGGKLEGEGFLPLRSEKSGRVVVNVDSFGAVGDGICDDTLAFRSAWDTACSTQRAVLLVPEGRQYLVNATRFKGPCTDKLIIQISGTIIAPSEPKEWDPKNPKVWLVFSELDGVTFQGGGEFYGSGKKWWETSCKKLKTSDCRSGVAPTVSPLFYESSTGTSVRTPCRCDAFTANALIKDPSIKEKWIWDPSKHGEGKIWTDTDPTRNAADALKHWAFQALTIDSSSRIRVKNLSLKDSQRIHFTISRSDSVRVSKLLIQAPSDSPNTDGIHVTDTTDIVIQNSKIGTGDDCISIVNGTENLNMKNIYCGPGHGISIGSLGEDNTLNTVSQVVLDTATLQGTTNGLRIKTWQGGSGYVRAVLFRNVKMIDVSNPIIIDQFYCDSSTPCQNQTSAVEISQITYENISGTSKTPMVMKFACSDAVPCRNIVLADINLETDNGNAETFCNCAVGFDYGVVRPPADCLHEINSTQCEAKQDSVQEKIQEPIHTEL